MSSQPRQESIAKRALHGAFYLGIASYAILATSFIGGIVLARILEPADFGTVAFANFFYSLIGRLKDHGFDGALIHREDDVQTAANTHLVLHVSISALVVIVAALIFPVLVFFHNATIGWIVLANALIFLLGSPSMTCSRLLDKEMRYKHVSILGTVGTLLVVVTQLSLAFMGWGLWSLVFGGIPARIWAVAASWRWTPVRPRIKLDWGMAKWYFRFGPYYLAVIGGFATLVIEQLNTFLVGSLVSLTALGFFIRAYGWADLPTQRVTHIISGTAFPVYAKLQSERQRLSRAFQLVQRAVSRLSFPLAVYLIVVIPYGTRFLIGERWLPVAPIFQIFVAYMFTRPLYDDMKLILTAVGELRIVNRIQVTMAVAMAVIAPLLILALPYAEPYLPAWIVNQGYLTPSAEALYGTLGAAKEISLLRGPHPIERIEIIGTMGAAVAIGVVQVIGLGIGMYYLRRFVDVNGWKMYGPPLAGAVLAGIVTVAVHTQLPPLQDIVLLATHGVVMGLTYLVVLVLLEGRDLLTELRNVRQILREI
jgi:O-antigen/teichoic acid export membrane protein